MRVTAIVLIFLAACGGEDAVDVPSAETAKTPISELNIYLDGFHFYSGALRGQMEAHHYCSKVNEDLTQCVIFDGNRADARLMGIEYVISARLFAGLQPVEKRMWHSHRYEVKSGALIAPGIADVAERELMEKMVGTYGKTWHTWHTDKQHPLPLGIPQLMAGFTADGQLQEQLIAARDARFGISTAEKRQHRANIGEPPIDPAADQGLAPDAPQLRLVTAADPNPLH